MNVYELLAGAGPLRIKVATDETFVTKHWHLEDDGAWLSIRPTRKFVDGSEYPMDERLIVLNIAHIVWIAEATK